MEAGPSPVFHTPAFSLQLLTRFYLNDGNRITSWKILLELLDSSRRQFSASSFQIKNCQRSTWRTKYRISTDGTRSTICHNFSV